MRITEHQLRRIIRVSLNEDSRPTIGAVLDAIEAIQGAENKAAREAEAAAIASGAKSKRKGTKKVLSESDAAAHKATGGRRITDAATDGRPDLGTEQCF